MIIGSPEVLATSESLLQVIMKEPATYRNFLNGFKINQMWVKSVPSSSLKCFHWPCKILNLYVIRIIYFKFIIVIDLFNFIIIVYLYVMRVKLYNG